MIKLNSQLNKLQISPILLVVLTTVSATISTNAFAQISPQPLPTPTQFDNSIDPVIQKLSGTWQGEDPSGSDTLTFIFTPQGKLFLVSTNSNKLSTAVELRYKVNANIQPMHLDVILPNVSRPVLTIFELTADGKMRLQLEGTDVGKSRPKEFSMRATVFEKTSDSTMLPKNIHILDPLKGN
jgi:hypothetical protein